MLQENLGLSYHQQGWSINKFSSDCFCRFFQWRLFQQGRKTKTGEKGLTKQIFTATNIWYLVFAFTVVRAPWDLFHTPPVRHHLVLVVLQSPVYPLSIVGSRSTVRGSSVFVQKAENLSFSHVPSLQDCHLIQNEMPLTIPCPDRLRYCFLEQIPALAQS